MSSEIPSREMNPLPDATEIEWFQRKLISWGKKNYREFPWRSAKNPVHQLIAEILLQRTKAEQVVNVFRNLVLEYPMMEDLARLSEKDWSEIISPLGLHWRAALLPKLMEVLVSDYDSSIPDDYDGLVELPGVGSYVASAYLSFHRGVRNAIIDSNTVRVLGRFFSFKSDGETRRKKWLVDFADRITPCESFKAFNYAMLDLAGAVCRRVPRCDICPLGERCRYWKMNRPE